MSKKEDAARQASVAKSDRKERLASELRANLKKRKERNRAARQDVAADQTADCRPKSN